MLGKLKAPYRRKKEFRIKSQKGIVNVWFREMLSNGREPVFTIIAGTRGNDTLMEQFYINKYTKAGQAIYNVCNKTNYLHLFLEKYGELKF